MKIILIRHAKVLLESKEKISASQMNIWVEKYNNAPIDTTLPSKEVIQRINDAHFVLASSLSRTVDSLEVIGVEPIEENSLFDEIDLPKTQGFLLKLSPKMWLVLLRLMMLVGFGKKSKVYTEAKHRAKRASDHLIHLANKHESIALMGHGGMHWLLSRELERLGWECIEHSNGSKNWGFKVYHIHSKNET
ncbi:MAG TPA: hypothetical protein EYH42_01660 [Sulfurovum sp.]|nr:hypothetical protein [Sulfurovum sp.]